MVDSLDIPRLADGVAAQIFDGEIATPQSVVLRLNMASLSKRVSIHVCDAFDNTVLSSFDIQDLTVMNPRNQAKAESRAEVWLSLRQAHIRIKGYYDCLAIERWLRQFSRRKAWRGQNNQLAVLMAFAAMMGLSLVASTIANVTTDIILPRVSQKHWRSLSPAYNLTSCDHPGVIEVLEPLLDGLMPATNIDLVVLPRAIGKAPVFASPGGVIVLNVDALSDLGEGGAVTAGLALVLSQTERRRPETQIVNSVLQRQAAQVAQLRLAPDVSTHILAQTAVSYRLRQQLQLIDRATIDRLEIAGHSTTSLPDYLSALANSDDPVVSQRVLPSFLNTSTAHATRKASIGALLGNAVFVPGSANPGLSDQNLDLLVQVCQ